MSCLSAAQRAAIEAKMLIKQAQLDALNEEYLNAISSSKIKSYTFDSGEGRQSTTHRSLKEISDEITRLEAEISRLTRQLAGSGIVMLTLRRRRGCYLRA